MSFLLPSLRNAFRCNLRTSTNILRQPHTFTSLHPFHRPLPIPRLYSQNNPRNQDPSSTNEPATPHNSSSPPKDPLAGDTPATPGSILSEYIANPQGSQLEPSTSGSGGLPKKEEYISSTDRKRERIAKFVTWGCLLSLLGGSIYLGRPLDQEEEQRMGWGTVHTPIPSPPVAVNRLIMV